EGHANRCVKISSHDSCFDVPCSKYPLSPVEGPQRIVAAREFVGWLEHFGEMSVNDPTSMKESTNGDLSTLSMGFYRLSISRRNGASSRIPTGNKSPMMQVDRRKTDHGNMASS
ncbi:hypothetical protein AVEN_252021-1, partial [Araneus ventricosus]